MILGTMLEDTSHFRQNQNRHQDQQRERGQEEGGPNAPSAPPGRGWARSVEAGDAGAHADEAFEPRAIEGDDEEVKGSFGHTYCTRSRRLCALLPRYRPTNTATTMQGDTTEEDTCWVQLVGKGWAATSYPSPLLHIVPLGTPPASSDV